MVCPKFKKQKFVLCYVPFAIVKKTETVARRCSVKKVVVKFF